MNKFYVSTMHEFGEITISYGKNPPNGAYIYNEYETLLDAKLAAEALRSGPLFKHIESVRIVNA